MTKCSVSGSEANSQISPLPFSRPYKSHSLYRRRLVWDQINITSRRKIRREYCRTRTKSPKRCNCTSLFQSLDDSDDKYTRVMVGYRNEHGRIAAHGVTKKWILEIKHSRVATMLISTVSIESLSSRPHIEFVDEDGLLMMGKELLFRSTMTKSTLPHPA
jgi:hypothetical protein